MRRWQGLFVAAALLLTQLGCATYKPASLPTDAETSAPAHDRPVVHVGAMVRGVLHTGETFSGTVSRVTPDELVLGRPGNFGLEEQVIDRADIAVLEIEKSTRLTSVVTTTAAVAVAGFLALWIFMSSTVEWGNT